MIELLAFNTLNAANKRAQGLSNTNNVLTTVEISFMIIWIVLFIFAIMRALRCSNATPDSRAIHIMFATASPVLYIICSYAVSGFCKF